MKRQRILSLLICLALVFTHTALALDEMPPAPPGGMMGPPPGGGPGGGDAAPAEAAIVIADGAEDTESEYEPGAYGANITRQGDVLVIEGLDMTSSDYTFNGLTVTGPDSFVRLRKANIRLGVTEPASGDDKGGAAVNLDNGATVYISDSNLIVDGAARYVTAAYNDATLIVNDSLVQSTGSNENTLEIAEPFSNEALLISGTARANFSIGATKTYYFNSTCTAEGWAALSTDSATGDGLDLFAYNTDGIAEHGGYGAYADTNCRVWLFGSRLTAAEIGAIISKSGRINVRSTGAADDVTLMYLEGDPVEADSALIGGRNAVMIHAPDMMGQGLWAADCGTFLAEDAYIGTAEDLKSTKNYYDYGEAVGAYIDYVSGSDFLIRSTSATITLKNVEMESYNNTLVHTVLNADSMGNFLAPGDGNQVEPVYVQMEDMDVSGDIRHEDYQRRMVVNLKNTTLSGNIVSGTMESWNDTWKDYGDVNWVVDDSFDANYGVSLNLLEGSVWNVTGESSLSLLTLAEGAVVNGEITLDGEPLAPEANVTYQGEILVTGDYVPPEPEEPEEEPAREEAETTSQPAAVTETPSAAPEPEAPAPAPEPVPEQAPEQDGHGGIVTAAVIVLAAAALGICVGIFMKKRKKQDQ